MTTGVPSVRRGVRMALAGAGGLVFLVGILVLASPRTATRSRSALVALLGNDYFPVALAGVVALLVFVIAMAARVKTGLVQTTPPAAEGVYPAARYGEGIESFVSGAGLGGLTGTDRHEAVRSRLREIAITTVMRANNCTQAEAADRIDDGTWTDDDVAGAFLTSADPPGLGTRLTAVVRGTSPYREAARATAAEIARLDREASK